MAFGDARARARASLERHLFAAKHDFATFLELAARVEGGLPAKVGAVHREWVRLMNANDQLILFAPVGHAKTFLMRWRLLWELGRNPNLRTVLIGATQALPMKTLSAIRTEIEANPIVHRVFPHLQEGRTWGKKSIEVKRSGVFGDPSIAVCGVAGDILGARLDVVVLDDVCNLQNTLTNNQRDKSFEWLTSVVLSRRPPPPNRFRVWAIGNSWHKEDALHRLSRLKAFRTFRYRSTVTGDDGEPKPLIPELWTLEALAEARDRYGRFAPMLLDNELLADGAGRIRQSWIDQCLERGAGLRLLPTWNPSDAPTYTGVDFGASDDEGETVFFTIAVLPDGTRQIIDVRGGHWSAPDILRNAIDVHQRYGSILAFEDNAAQKWMREFGSELTAIPIRGHHTGMNKHHMQFGVESIGMELSQGKWAIPCSVQTGESGIGVHVPEPEVAKWISEMLDYSPLAHTGDRLMAAWICREAARKSPAGGLLDGKNEPWMHLDLLSR